MRERGVAMKGFSKDQRGATTLEYAILMALLAYVMLAGLAYQARFTFTTLAVAANTLATVNGGGTIGTTEPNSEGFDDDNINTTTIEPPWWHSPYPPIGGTAIYPTDQLEVSDDRSPSTGGSTPSFGGSPSIGGSPPSGGK